MGPDGRRIVAALTATKIGDRVVDVKTVLPWLLGALGAPTVLVGLLVPVRESGSMLPQTALLPWVRSRARRSPVWLLGAAGQAAAVAAMAVVALTLQGTAAGLGVLAAVVVFAGFRSLTSLTTKDVLGRTVAKGARGRVTGTATTMSGVVAITVGLGLRALGADAPTWAFAALLGGAASMWLVAMVPFSRVQEPPGEHDEDVDASAITDGLALLRDDRDFRRFVLARTLLLVSALTPPYVVSLAQGATGDSIAGVGPFVVATGVATLLGGRLWGGVADASSRGLIAGAAGAASAVVAAFLLVEAGDLLGGAAFYVGVYFVLALVHTAARVGRKTYVVDLGEGNDRTDYVAVSNTLMAVLLLVVGGITSALATLGPAVALAVLAVIGALGVPAALSLPAVSAGEDPERAGVDDDEGE